MRSIYSCFALAAALVLSGCNGTATSINFPAQAPWSEMATGILSPTDDLVAVSAGAGLATELLPGNFEGLEVIVACDEQGSSRLEYCTDRTCDPQAVCGPGATVLGKRYTYTLLAHLDRSALTSGGIQLVDGTGATVMGLAIQAGGADRKFDLAAGFSEGLIPGVQFSDVDELGTLILAPHWSDFGAGEIPGKVCAEGVCKDGTVVLCETDGEIDRLGFSTIAQPGTYAGSCGTVPVSLTFNPRYASVGACLSQRKALCDRLTGQSRKTCNHAQIGICHAAFHVPSAHNR